MKIENSNRVMNYSLFYLLIFLIFASESFFASVFAEARNDSINKAEVYFEQGVKFSQMGSVNQAIGQFKKTLELNPKHADAQCFLGVEIYKMAVPNQDVDLLKKAIIELEKSLKLNSALGVAHDVLSFAYYILGEFEVARQHQLKAISLGIKNPVVEKKLNQAFKFMNGETNSPVEKPLVQSNTDDDWDDGYQHDQLKSIE